MYDYHQQIHIRSNNYLSYSSFYFDEKRIIFINGYVTLSLGGIDEIIIVSIKSNFLSHEGRCPVTESPPKKSPPGDSISIQNLPPEDLFRNRFAPRRLYSKTKSPGGETISSPVEINSPRGRVYFDAS